MFSVQVETVILIPYTIKRVGKMISFGATFKFSYLFFLKFSPLR